MTLQRSFVDVPRDPAGGDLTFQRVQATDTRVPAPGKGARTVELALPVGAAALSVAWQIVYQRMSTPMAEAFGVPQVLDEIVVASGELSAQAVSQHVGGPR